VSSDLLTPLYHRQRVNAYYEGGQLRPGWKSVAKQDAQAIAKDALLAASFLPMGRAGKYAFKGYQMYRGTKLAQVVRTVKRPITSTITRLGYSSKPETGVRIYGIGKGLVGLADPLATTRALMRGDYAEAAVTFYGPPFAGQAYRHIKQSLASSSSPSQQNGGAKGKKSPYGKKLSKLPKGYYYTKKKGEQCAHGFKHIGNRCVKQ